MDQLLTRLRNDFSELEFVDGETFQWSPNDNQITYKHLSDREEPAAVWALLHELAHALLSHQTYKTDLELLLMEVSAWEKAEDLAADYGYSIDPEHVQDCLDTYRDWLYMRSTCPACSNTSLQQNSNTYQCFNCRTKWRVSASRFCRPYRQTSRGNKKTSPSESPSATFI